MKLIAIPESSYNDIQKDIIKTKANLSSMHVEARDKEYKTNQYWSLYQDTLCYIRDLETKMEDKL